MTQQQRRNLWIQVFLIPSKILHRRSQLLTSCFSLLALRFQPIRRPQVKQTKAKTGVVKALPNNSVAGAVASARAATTSNTGITTAAATAPAQLQQPKGNTLADWAATEDDEYFYDAGERRQRGGRKKKKKKFNNAPVETNWDELYDPARPTNVDEYLRSDERISEVREWKAVLYAHRRRRKPSYDSDMVSDEEEDARPAMSSEFGGFSSFASTHVFSLNRAARRNADRLNRPIRSSRFIFLRTTSNITTTGTCRACT